MGIDLHWINERGEKIDALLDPGFVTQKIVEASCGFDRTVCLRFIDPYGDTVFNQAQIEVLIEEIRAISDSALDPAAREHKEEILQLASKARGQIHTYLRFFGD